MINKKKFYIPKDQAESYDGDVLRFRFSEQELSQYQRELPIIWDSDNMQEKTTTLQMETNEEEHIPLTREEWLNVFKKSQGDQATITKKTSQRN
jgi:hypothetical protein